MTPKFSGQVELKIASALVTEEGTMTIKKESLVTPDLSCQVKMGTAFTLTTEEATVTPKILSKQEQGTPKTPKYSSRAEFEVATSTRKEGRPR